MKEKTPSQKGINYATNIFEGCDRLISLKIIGNGDMQSYSSSA